MPSSNDEKWIGKGLLTAFECFECENHIDEKIDGQSVRILCKDFCNYKKQVIDEN
jgi:hypothetical protein